jgi:broad specificity phosphatase PhoE
VTTLLLARHGETDWNRDHRWQGHDGQPLNETGRNQARDLAARLDAVDAIYSSDSIRARETAEIAAARLQLEVCVDARLREVSFGEWEGLTRAEINDRFADGFARWLACEQDAPDGGESDDAMAERVLQALLEISERHPGRRVLVVTSGGPIRAALAEVRGIDNAFARMHIERAANCELLEFLVRDGVLIDPAPSGGRGAAVE